MVVQHNIPAMNANRLYGINNSGLSKSLEKLSSGYAINRAGDNAAGLAVSEKMRAQISGLTQASKNAEDGISMVQTFEGALQETDSILQRMRTLAVQSANGTYQNDVDREAIQLEYDQLNDELNQIADTDFNGVVVLNGGQMADGTKAVNGEFDYTAGVKASSKLDKSDVNVVDAQGWDNGTVANTAWKALNATWTRTAGQPDTNGPDSVDVTLKYNKSDSTWTVTNASDGADKAKITASKISDGNGGFKLAVGGVDVANVVIDTSKLGNGDEITLTLNNPANSITKPDNMGATVIDNTNFTYGSDTTNAIKLEDADLTITNSVTQDQMKSSADVNSLMEKLNGATVEMTYNSGAKTAAGDIKITLTDGTVIKGTDTKLNIGGTTFTIDGATAAGTIDIKDAAGTSLVKIAAAAQATAPAKDTTLSSGSISYKIGIEHAQYNEAAKPSIEVKKTGTVSRSDSNNASTANLTYTDNVTLQVGARTKDSVNFTFQYESNGIGDLEADLDCSARGLGTDQLSLATQEDANGAIDKIDNAINKVSMVRASFGAMQNRLEHKIANLDTNNENLTAAESRIRDTDMAEEMTNFTKNQILAQASQAMLAQANQLPQGVLQLLG